MNKLQSQGFGISDTHEPDLSGRAKQLSSRWQSVIADLADNFAAQETSASPCIAKSTLDTADYTDNFPQHVMECPSGTKDKAADERATPATCLHVYQQLANSQLSDTEIFRFSQTRCRRKERGEWKPPFVLSAFTMIEVVVLGCEASVQETRQSFKRSAEDLFKNQGLPVSIHLATDAFFLGENSGAHYLQKLKELKHEFVVTFGDATIPVGSVNLHEDYFGRNFSITGQDGDPCWSACLAFGLERIVACDILQNE